MKKIIKWIIIVLVLTVTAFTTFSTVQLYSIVKDLQQQNEQLEIDKQQLIEDNMMLSDRIYKLEDKYMTEDDFLRGEEIIDEENNINNSEITSSVSRNKVEKNAIITYYAELPNELGNGSVTASGKQVQDGFIAAPDEYEFGTEIIIDGKTYVVEDRGGYINTLEDGTIRLNIFVPRLDGENDTDYNNRVLQMGVTEVVVEISTLKESQEVIDSSENVVEDIPQNDVIQEEITNQDNINMDENEIVDDIIQEEVIDQIDQDDVVISENEVTDDITQEEVIDDVNQNDDDYDIFNDYEDEVAIDNDDPSKLNSNFENIFEVPDDEQVEVIEVVERDNDIITSIVNNKDIIIKVAIALVFVVLVIVLFSGNDKKSKEDIEHCESRRKYEMNHQKEKNNKVYKNNKGRKNRKNNNEESPSSLDELDNTVDQISKNKELNDACKIELYNNEESQSSLGELDNTMDQIDINKNKELNDTCKIELYNNEDCSNNILPNEGEPQSPINKINTNATDINKRELNNTNNNGLKNNNNKVYTPDKGRSPSLNKKDK